VYDEGIGPVTGAFFTTKLIRFVLDKLGIVVKSVSSIVSEPKELGNAGKIRLFASDIYIDESSVRVLRDEIGDVKLKFVTRSDLSSVRLCIQLPIEPVDGAPCIALKHYEISHQE
jgi:hypothetical protein